MSGSIPIRNVYVMLAYAFSSLRSPGQDRFASEEFEHLHELFAAILIDGVSRQVKRGLQHGYVTRSEELATVRGRIDVTRTATQRSLTRGRLVCEHDDYETDTAHNRALKAVMTLLIRHGAVSRGRKVELRNLLQYFTEVHLIDPTTIRWNTLTYHRGISGYRLLLGVCELVVKGTLQGQAGGDAILSEWLSDEKMHDLYERFLRNYFTVHHRELKPAASKIPWDKAEGRSPKDDHLPQMKTDLVLRSAGRTLIVDAKYYGNNLQVSRFVGQMRNRTEPVTYWLTLGDRVITDRYARFVHLLRLSLSRETADGFLVRVSSLDEDSKHAFAKQAEFMDDLLSAMNPGNVVRLAGRP